MTSSDDAQPVGSPAEAWTDRVPARTWDDAARLLTEVGEAGGRIVLAGHVEPDGDALGSTLALHLYLRRLGYRSVATWGTEPFQVPPQYTFLPGLDTLTPPSEVGDDVDLLVALDCGAPDRLGTLRPLLDRDIPTLVIDHHSSSTPFGDVSLVVPDAAATAVLVDELIRRMGGELDHDLAACLYVGVVTDTGRFQNASTDEAALALGSRLLAYGLDSGAMTRQMFQTHSLGYLQLVGRALERSVFEPEASLVHTWIPVEDMRELGVALEETEDLIDLLRTMDAAEVAMVLKEVEPGRWKASLRSKGRIDVGQVSTALGGGGHTFSAGFSSTLDRSSILATIVGRLADDERTTRTTTSELTPDSFEETA